ncbi:MAG: ATP-binding protein [Halieaceae bacterium]|nr:ATP-binding protein [Halieaceae bacterium]
MSQRPAILNRPSPPILEQQKVSLFRIYVVYRSILSIVLLLSPLISETRRLLGGLNPELYLVVAIVFLATNLVLLALMQTRLIHDRVTQFSVFFTDIVVITLLSDTSGGMSSGLPILLLATAAASAVVIDIATIATLIAALSVIAILADTLRLINEEYLPFDSLLPAGLLSALVFAVSLLIQVVARRVGRAEKLARERSADLYNLQRLNEQIVRNLQTGILLVYADGEVRVMNQAAARLLDPNRPVALEQGRRLADYHELLARQFQAWQESGTHDATPLHIADDAPQVVANFSPLEDLADGDALVFLEDYTAVTQQAQSLKLTSLGRLTASIAHEIRNPLGAVSHAAQLLGESEQLVDNDQELAGIIQHHAKRMNSVIENVLQISRRQPPNPQRLALKGWMQSFIAQYRQTRPEQVDIDLALPEEWLEVTFDPAHLERVLGNLLDNGLRHSRAANGHGKVCIKVKKDPEAQRCVVDVIDAGHGVAESERAKLFEPFYTTVDKGTGLGLYLSKELCEINNATLTYRPTAAGESCFRVTVSRLV